MFAAGIERLSDAESSPDQIRQAPVEAKPKERKLREYEQDIGKTIERKIP